MVKGNSKGVVGEALESMEIDKTSDDGSGNLVILPDSGSECASLGSLIIHTNDGNPSDSEDYMEDCEVIEKGVDENSISNGAEEDLIGVVLGKPRSRSYKPAPRREDPRPGVKFKYCVTCDKNISTANLAKHFHVHPPSDNKGAETLERNLKELITRTAHEIRPAFVRGGDECMAGVTSSRLVNNDNQSGTESDNSDAQKIFVRPLKDIHRKPELLDPPLPEPVTVFDGGMEVEPAEIQAVQPSQKTLESLKRPVKPAVAKKSCSKTSKKKEYLSESDEPVSPAKNPKSSGVNKDGVAENFDRENYFTPEKNMDQNRKSRTEVHNSDTESDGDDIPLVIRLRQEAEAKGVKKSMPKPPPKLSKFKRAMTKQLEADSASKRRRTVELNGFKKDNVKKIKSKKPKQVIISKKKPKWSDEEQAAAELIASESKKEKPDFSILEKPMGITFHCRKYMYDKNTDIAQVFDSFPALHDYRFIKKELESVRTKLYKLEGKLQEPLILEYQRFLTKNYLSPDPVIANARKELKAVVLQDTKGLLRDIQMLCLGYQKTEEEGKGKLQLRGHLYQQRNAKEDKFIGVTPTIDIKGNIGSSSCQLTVYCEKLKICKPPNFYDAILCVYALYWMFNLEYETNAKPLFEFFDTLTPPLSQQLLEENSTLRS